MAGEPNARLAGHALIEALIEQGVDTIHGVPGESFLAALDGLVDHPGRIRFVACRHEGAAAFMAETDGKLTGRPGVCFVTRGPGASHAAIGLHTAFQDSTPMLLLVGQVASDQRDREAFQELDYRQFFGPGTLGMAKWVGEVQQADRLPEYVARAFRVAMQGRPGPVVLALPEDMLTTMTSAPVLPRVEALRAHPDPAALVALEAELARAERPLLVVGGPGWTKEGSAALQRWVERWGLPVANAFRFLDTFDQRHPQYVGDFGLGMAPELAALVKDADLILAFGIRLGEMTTLGYTLLEPPRPRQRLVHVHAGAEELGRVYRPDVAVLADVDATARVLADRPAGAAPAAWSAWLARGRAALDAQRSSEPTPPLDLAEVMRQAQQRAGEAAVFTNGAGNFAGWVSRYVVFPGLHHRGRTHLAPTSGAMGYGLPAAVAAALRFPERHVVGVCGDGDFMMNDQELTTARVHGANQGAGRLVVLLFDNASYGTIRMHQIREFPGRPSGTALVNPDFPALARAHGWRAADVARTEDFAAAFDEALQPGPPMLIRLAVPPHVIGTRMILKPGDAR